MTRQAFRARRAVIPDGERSCLVTVQDGVIAAVDPIDARSDADEVIEVGADEVLLPGLVDTHVHVNEPGRTEWEGFDSATRAAAAGGVTTIIDMPLNSIPPTTSVAALEEKRRSADSAVHVDVGFWGGAVPDNLAELAALHEGGVFGFKCFLVDSGVPEFPPLAAGAFSDAMTAAARLGALMIVHAEDSAYIDDAPEPSGAQYAAFLRSRPSVAEDEAIRWVGTNARITGTRTHILHLSSASALEVLREFRAMGVNITAETCPHYLTLDAAAIPDGATQFKCCPPIRDAANRDRLWDGLANGHLDMIVSDHSPATLAMKTTGDFGTAWGGIASVQLGLPVVWTAARDRGHSLADVVRWMARNPADRVGLVNKGRIEVGADADLCVFAPDEMSVVDPARLHHRHPVSVYAGRTLRGVVRRSWLRGARIEPTGPPRGSLLRREPR